MVTEGSAGNHSSSWIVFLPFDGVLEVGLTDCVVIQEDRRAGAVFPS